MNITSRKIAISQGAKLYFTGKPCKHGHLVNRRTATGQCVECEKIRQRTDERREYSRNIIKTEKYKNQREQYRKSVMDTPKYKEWSKSTHLSRSYGLSMEQYQTMCESQDNKCAICQTTLEDGAKCVDHCHTTGTIRGIVCHGCNKMIGFAKDNTQILQQAIIYLQRYQLS